MHHQPDLNHYKLKRGDKTQIAFSGGRSSGFQLYHIIKANPWLAEETWKEDSCVSVLFSNTGREYEETYEFVKRCGEEWGIKITWVEFSVKNPGNLPLDDMEPEDVVKYLRGYEEQIGGPTYKIVDFETANRTGIPFLKAVLKHRMLPHRAVRFCTSDLKIKTTQRYIVKHLGWKAWRIIIGFRSDEESRLDKNKETARKNKDRFSVAAPMVDDGVTSEDVGEFWREMRKKSFDLDFENLGGKCVRSNCTFCPWKSELAKVTMLQEHPNEFEWWNRLEKAFTEKYGKPHYFTQDSPMEELKEFVHRNPETLEQEGAFCQASGDCFGSEEDGDAIDILEIFEDE